MKTLVVATDFSPGANRAVDFALKLANAQHATLTVVHAFHAWPTNPSETGVGAAFGSRALHDVCQRELDAIVQDLMEKSGVNVPIRTVVLEGYAIPTVLAVVQREKADLLIMSTVGSAPQSARMMGSVATAMVSETTVPLLLIPPTATYTAMKNVVMGIDLTSPPDAVTLDTALIIAHQLNCVVNLLCLCNQPVTAQIRSKAEHIRSLMRHIPHTLTILSGSEVYDTLIQFSHTNKANLIIMLPQKHSWIRKLFVESTTEQTARLTDIPVLAII